MYPNGVRKRKKMSFIVYRVQDEYGNGPYRGKTAGIKWKSENHCRASGRPLPHDDGLMDEVKPYYLFGFKNIKQLSNWFKDDELIILNRYNVRIYEIEVKKIYSKLNKQVIFNKFDIISSKVWL
jgi:hypothetical protein